MCPKAAGANVKYAYLDHDTDTQLLAPPIQNQWYTIFHAYDVRLLWCVAYQRNDEAAAKNIEVRWTIDGTVYFTLIAMNNNTDTWISRSHPLSAGGTDGLRSDVSRFNAAYFVDKRGQDFKVEIRITSALGTNQLLNCYCVRETLEQT